jgi:hypothetical protein
MIDLGKCEELLREQKGIDEKTELIILKFEKITNKLQKKMFNMKFMIQILRSN